MVQVHVSGLDVSPFECGGADRAASELDASQKKAAAERSIHAKATDLSDGAP